MFTIDLQSLFSYLRSHSVPVVETELLREFLPEAESSLTQGVSLELYRKHFILYHHLYKLEQRLWDSEYALFIKNIWIYLLRRPDDGHCSFFDEDRLCYCNLPCDREIGMCEYHHHQERQIRDDRSVVPQHIRHFYLNEENIDTIDEEKLEVMLRGVYEYFSAFEEIDECLRIMDLDIDFSMKKLRSRYRYLSKKYHPDLSTATHPSEQEFKRITYAYSVLHDFRNISI